jgi:hypothetical protein
MLHVIHVAIDVHMAIELDTQAVMLDKHDIRDMVLVMVPVLHMHNRR